MRDAAGTFTIDGEPAAGEQIVLFAAGRPPHLDFTTTGDDGSFRLEAPSDAGVLAKARRDTLALCWGEPGGDWRLDAATHAIQLRVAGAEPPAELSVWLDPEEVPGLPGEAMRLVHVSGPRVRDAHYARRPLPANGAHLRLATGTWRLAAEAVYDQPTSTHPVPDTITVAARAGATQLPGDAASGFRLVVDGPLEVTLELGAATRE